MNEYQKSLDWRTYDRISREWDRRVGKHQSFSIDAVVSPGLDGTEQDRISIVEVFGQPESYSTPFNRTVIEQHQMDDDIRPLKLSPEQKRAEAQETAKLIFKVGKTPLKP
jgi:hypothetical protein